MQMPVAVKEGASLLADAAEEIGLHLSEKIEQRTHGNRQVGPGRSARRLTIEQITAYLEKSRQPLTEADRQARVQDLLNRAQTRGESLAREGTHAQNPTEHYLLLQQALQTALSDHAPQQVIERLEQALADLEAQSGTQIQANLATIDQAASFGQTAQSIGSFQASIHAILGKPTLGQAFQEALTLAEKNGSKLDSAVHHLMEALGNCLSTLGSLREKALLETLLKDLFHLKCLNTLHQEAKTLIRALRRKLQRDAAAKERGRADRE